MFSSKLQIEATTKKRRRRRKLTWFVATVSVLICVAIVGSLGLSFYVGWNLTHPKHAPITVTPQSFHLPYENVAFPARTDGTHLSGWFIPSQTFTDKVVVLAHGYRQNRMKDEPSLPSAAALHNAGFSVLMFDFRDSGQSDGHEVTVGLLEERDLLGAIDYVKRRGFHHIGLLGFSMGASTSLMATADDANVEAVIADSPFANLYNYLSVNMPVWTHLPNWPFTGEIFWEIQTFLHLNAHLVDPLGDLAHWKPRPMLLIAGTADDTIPANLNSKKLYAEVKSDPEDTLWMVKGAKHVGAYHVDQAEYLRRVTDFFTAYLNTKH